MPYWGPKSAIGAVLQRLGIDPTDRFDEFDQDAEYTACRVEELDAYYLLYRANNLSVDERRVLGCFMLQCLNDGIELGAAQEFQKDIIAALFADAELHGEELAYWMNVSDRDPENWWPLAKAMFETDLLATDVGAGRAFSAGDCPVCADSGAAIFVKAEEAGAIFWACPACGCAWAEPPAANTVDSISPPTMFASSGFRVATWQDIGRAGLLGKVERSLVKVIFEGTAGYLDQPTRP